MKKRISLALAAVFAYVLSSCSLFGNSGLKDYKNEVDEDEFYDEGEELLDDLGYLDDDAFECDFEISYSEKFEEKSVKVYDGSSKKYESTETEESTATYTYDDDNKVIHGKMTEKENSKSPSGKSTYSSSEEMYIQHEIDDLSLYLL